MKLDPPDQMESPRSVPHQGMTYWVFWYFAGIGARMSSKDARFHRRALYWLVAIMLLLSGGVLHGAIYGDVDVAGWFWSGFTLAILSAAFWMGSAAQWGYFNRATFIAPPGPRYSRASALRTAAWVAVFLAFLRLSERYGPSLLP